MNFVNKIMVYLFQVLQQQQIVEQLTIALHSIKGVVFPVCSTLQQEITLEEKIAAIFSV